MSSKQVEGMGENYREAVWKRSELDAPFCPDCDEEMDSLSLHNSTDTCKCGTWYYDYKHKMRFTPKKGKKL